MRGAGVALAAGRRRQAGGGTAVKGQQAWPAAITFSGGCQSRASALTSTACLTFHTDTFSSAAESRCLPLRS